MKAKQAVDILHLIFCDEKHETDMNSIHSTSFCTYYLEESVDVCWEMKSHVKWLEVAHQLSMIGELDEEVLRAFGILKIKGFLNLGEVLYEDAVDVSQGKSKSDQNLTESPAHSDPGFTRDDSEDSRRSWAAISEAIKKRNVRNSRR